jgi:ribonuclease HII
MPNTHTTEDNGRRRPDLAIEQHLFDRGFQLCGGVDEVGRGSLAGPVTVGIVVLAAGTRDIPAGLADSKMLSPAAREALVPAICRWAAGWAVGHASAAEIDLFGILDALNLAGRRAFQQLPRRPQHLVLDGSYNWLRRPPVLPGLGAPGARRSDLGCEVSLMPKADRLVASVAAASVIAKVRRDGLMARLARWHPGYGWERNVGYGTPAHLAAIRQIGPCAQHRRSWKPFIIQADS